MEGKNVTTSYSSATPIPPLFSEAPGECIPPIVYSFDKEESKNELSKSVESSLASMNELCDEIDLTSLSTKNIKRHFKVKTTPNSSISPSREFKTTDSGQLSESGFTDSKSNLSDLLPKHSTKSLTGIGDFIPSVGQYKRLLEQLDLVINCLPPELVMNVRDC